DFVQTIAGCDLRDLQALDQYEPIQKQSQFRHFIEQCIEHLSLDSKRGPRNLHNGAVRSSMKSYSQRGSDDTFVTDDGDFNASSITRQHDQRGQAFIQEVRELKPLASFMQDVMMR